MDFPFDGEAAMSPWTKHNAGLEINQRFFAVLHIGGIKSPQDAVRSGYRGGATRRTALK
jgi:hypothetical protein